MREEEFYELEKFNCSYIKAIKDPIFNVNGGNGGIYLNRSCVEFLGFKEEDQFNISFRFKEGTNVFYILINPTDQTESVYSIKNKTMTSMPLVREIEKLLGIGMIGKLKHRFDPTNMKNRIFRLKLRDSVPITRRKYDKVKRQ